MITQKEINLLMQMRGHLQTKINLLKTKTLIAR